MVLVRHFFRYDDTTEKIMLALEQMLFLSEKTVNLFHNQPNTVSLFVHLDQNHASRFNLSLVLVRYIK